MCKVLIVEDEILIANLIEDYIISEGFTAEIALDYEEAIAAIDNNRIEIIILDVTISGTKSGIDVANYINENRLNIPFIYLTSFSDPATLKKLYETSPAGYLSKPFKQIDIVSALNIQALKVKDKALNSYNLKIGKTDYEIDVNNLLYVQADLNYSKLIFKNDKEILVRSSIKKLKELLPNNTVVRISKSVLVNPSFITKTTKSMVEINNNITFKYSLKYYNREAKSQ